MEFWDHDRAEARSEAAVITTQARRPELLRRVVAAVGRSRFSRPIAATIGRRIGARQGRINDERGASLKRTAGSLLGLSLAAVFLIGCTSKPLPGNWTDEIDIAGLDPSVVIGVLEPTGFHLGAGDALGREIFDRHATLARNNHAPRSRHATAAGDGPWE
ncbi:MAG: hypothetical protein ACYS0G_11860 [Planctomycetota bacterium]|jgi:hypothetical protein